MVGRPTQTSEARNGVGGQQPVDDVHHCREEGFRRFDGGERSKWRCEHAALAAPVLIADDGE